MGVFSSTKKIYVSSLAYNMAGDTEGRLRYLRSSVVSYVLAPEKSSGTRGLGDHFQRVLLNGPARNQINLFRWAKANYADGMPNGQLSLKTNVNADLVAARIVAPAGHTVLVSTAFMDSASPGYWAEKHILEKHPERVGSGWIYDYNSRLDRLTITYEDASTEIVYPGMRADDEYYLVAQYTFLRDEILRPQLLGTKVFGDLAAPSVTGFSLQSTEPAVALVPLKQRVRTVVTDSTGTGTTEITETETDISQSFDSWKKVWVRTVDVGLVNEAGRESFKKQEQTKTVWRSWKIEEDVVVGSPVVNGSVTSVTTTFTDQLVEVFDHRQDTQDRLSYAGKAEGRMLIYRLGSGQWPEIDALESRIEDQEPEFFPVLPIRLWNKNVDHPNFESQWKTWKKAYKKMTGSKLEDLLQTVSDNPNLGDVDHCFMLHGVAMNTQEKEGQRYIYEFLRKLATTQAATMADVNTWITQINQYNIAKNGLIAWQAGQAGPGMLFGGLRPYVVPLKMPSVSTLRIATKNLSQFDHRISWITIDEEIFAGLGKAGAKKGDFWFEAMSDIVVPVTGVQLGGFLTQGRENRTVNRFRMVWQDEDAFWRRLTVVGLVHENRVYEKRSVDITAKEALADPEESGFIFPLHEPTLRLLPLAQRTQLAVSNRYLIFNSYEVVKVRWYQKGVFKIIASILIAIAVAIVFPAAGGILGSNLSLGTSMGLAGTGALIAGAAVNAVAGFLVTTVVGNAAVEVFGEELGVILAGIITQLAFSYVAAGISGQPAGFVDWGKMMQAENLLQLTKIGAQVFSGYVNAERSELQDVVNRIGEDTAEQIEEIEKRRKELLGSGSNVLDPLLSLDNEEPLTDPFETREIFLQRTLLTGSDIVDLSLSMIGLYPSMTTEIPSQFP